MKHSKRVLGCVVMLMSAFGCAASEEAMVGEEARGAATLSDGIWNSNGLEFCQDFFPGKRCTASFPSPQCPGVVNGQACSPVGSVCYQTVSATRFRRFECI